MNWKKLLCKLDVVCFVWFMWVWGLTCDFVGEFEGGCLFWLGRTTRTSNYNGNRLVAAASPSLRPSAERWPLCGGFLDAGLKPRSTSEATATAEADPCGMTNKKDNSNSKCSSNQQRQQQGQQQQQRQQQGQAGEGLTLPPMSR